VTIVNCGNENHDPRKAVVRLSWPGGRFKPTTACASCLRNALYGVRDGEPDNDYPVLVSPLRPPTFPGYSIRENVIRALSLVEGCDASDAADVVLKALGMAGDSHA
jgi:hypothetical protein